MKNTLFLAALVVGASALPAQAQNPPAAATLAQMPVKEITVFKDGHALVLHEGVAPVTAAGTVVLDYLPMPVLGTFWPYSAEKGATLSSVTAGQRRLQVQRTALNLREILEANPGAAATITETGGIKYDAQLLGVPTRSGDELEATSPPNSGDMLPLKGDVLLVRTAGGVKVVPFGRIVDVTFKDAPKKALGTEEFRNLLTLKLEWGGRKPDKSARVGMMYLQKGIRWIPGYRLTLDGAGTATVKLQGTLINELADLRDVSANLVVGVPTFAFEGTQDPIGLQQVLAQMSPYFRRDSQTAFGLSNSMMSQALGGLGGERRGYREGAPGEPGPPDLGPEVAASGGSEDLYVFNVRHVTLKKGQRMVMPIAEYTLKYRDVYTLDLPFAPPPEVRGNLNTEQQAELARLMGAPRVMHRLRLTNPGPHPLTTAPALIVRGEQVLAQGMMTYTAAGADTDLTVTQAVDVRARRKDRETKRTPNAQTFQGQPVARVDLAGTISVKNMKAQAVDLEVTRSVLGNVEGADHDGLVERLSPFEDDNAASGRPAWWNSYNWPHWWHRFNSVSRVTWKLRLEPDQSVDLGYTWHYFAP